jgi:hypothetical protein
MAKKDDLTPKQAKEIIKKFCEPPYNAKEIRLKEDVRLVLKGEGKGYEGDDDEEEEGDRPQNNEPKGGAGESAAQGAASQATQSQGSSVLENVQQYAGEIITNVQSLGTAGSVALSSATYFQAETVVESSHDIVAIVEEVEEDYDMTLQNYFVETTATFIDDIAQKQAERQAEKEQRQAERQEAKEQRQAERESKSEEKSEQKSEEAQEEQKSEAKSEEKSEAKSEEKSEQKSEEPKQEEQKQEPKAEEPKSEPKSEPQAEEPKSEPKAEPQAESQAEPQAETPIPETPMDNGMMDDQYHQQHNGIRFFRTNKK